MIKKQVEYTTETDSITADVSCFTILPKEFWDKRHELHEAQQKSMEAFKNMTTDEQLALISKVRKGMAIMHDNVEHWLPDAITMDKTGDLIRIEFNFLAAEIDAEVSLLSQATSFEVAETARKTAELISETEAANA